MRHCRFALFVFLLVWLATSRSSGQVPADLDCYVDTVLNTFKVPGISLAIVKDGKVLLTKGYGVKKIGEAAPVDEHTLFPIASNSKAFTAMALAILVDYGKLKWDDPVINYLPWFKMSDPWVTAQITIRDLLVHHSGIPAFAGDILIFPPSDYSRKQILQKLKDIPLVHSFRTTYAYDNILYLAAGEVITQVSGMDWEDFIKTRIFNKAGMGESISRFSTLGKAQNLATAHVLLQKNVVPANQFLDEEIGDVGDPAGGIVSNAVDMAKWLITELDSGRTPNHTSLLHATATKELWKVVTPIPIGTVPNELKPAQMDFFGYALGTRIGNYGKYKIVTHGGKLDGFVSHVMFVPGLKLGISVLTNQESTGAYWSVIYHLLDYYMQNPYFNWLKGYKHEMDKDAIAWQTEWDKAVITPTPSAPKPVAGDKYIGVYHDPFYGDLVISWDATGLQLQFKRTKQLAAKLVPFQYETFNAVFNNIALKANSYLSFTLGADGKVESCTLKVIDPASDIGFDGLLFQKEKNNK